MKMSVKSSHDKIISSDNLVPPPPPSIVTTGESDPIILSCARGEAASPLYLCC